MKTDHIDELTLNEYLDNALTEAERQVVEAHLAVCAACQTELADLQQLFFTLDNLAAVPLTTDLSAAVTAQIKQEAEKSVSSEQFSVNSWPLLIFELAATAVLLFFLWPTVQEWLLLVRSWQTQFIANVTLPDPVSWLETSVWITTPTVPQVDLAAVQWALLLGAALIIWLVGNRLLFTSPPQNGGSHG